MGTRALTHVVDEKGVGYVSLYRQFDGYPQGGHGEDLAEWLKDAVIGNGIGVGERRTNFFNGIGDLATRLVTFFKGDHTRAGGFYLVPPGGTDWSVDYTYTVICEDGFDREGGVSLEVKSYGGSIIFAGSVADFVVWMAEDNDN